MSSNNQSQQRTSTSTLEREPTVTKHAQQDQDRPRPESVHNPHTRDDPDTPSLLERVTPSTPGQWAAVFIVVSLLAASILYVTRLFPPGYHNPYIFAIGLLVAGYPVVALTFREVGFQARSKLDTVIYKFGNPTTGLSIQATLGKVSGYEDGFALRKEVKRTTWGGFVGDWLELGDVIPGGENLQSKRHRDTDDPSTTALEGKYTAFTSTELHGDVYVADATELEYDEESPEIDRRTVPPEYLGEGATGMLIAELQNAVRREEAAEERIDVVENILEDLRKRVEDEQLPELERAITLLEKLQDQQLGRTQQPETIIGDDQSSAVDRVDEQVDDELNNS